MRIRPPRWLFAMPAAARKALGILSLLGLGACADGTTQSKPEIVWDSARVAPSDTGLDADGCREYLQTVTIGGEEQQAFGRACLQPDGSWRVYAPTGAPRPMQASPPRATHAVPAYPVYRPSVFFGSTFIFGGHRHHHFKHRHFGHRHFKHHRFRHHRFGHRHFGHRHFR